MEIMTEDADLFSGFVLDGEVMGAPVTRTAPRQSAIDHLDGSEPVGTITTPEDDFDTGRIMTAAEVRDARLAELRQRYDIESHPLGYFMAKARRPAQFTCMDCGRNYASVWVGKHHYRPVCDDCVHKRNRELGIDRQPERPGYPMPAMYAKDGSKIDKLVHDWALDKSEPLALFAGGPGRGKTAQTHHLAALVHGLAWPYLLLQTRDILRISDEQFERAKTAQLVVLDEIGRRTSEHAIGTVCDILDARLPYERKTVVVTNLGPSAISDLDSRLASRLKCARAVIFDGPDLRNPEARARA